MLYYGKAGCRRIVVLFPRNTLRIQQTCLFSWAVQTSGSFYNTWNNRGASGGGYGQFESANGRLLCKSLGLKRGIPPDEVHFCYKRPHKCDSMLNSKISGGQNKHFDSNFYKMIRRLLAVFKWKSDNLRTAGVGEDETCGNYWPAPEYTYEAEAKPQNSYLRTTPRFWATQVEPPRWLCLLRSYSWCALRGLSWWLCMNRKAELKSREQLFLSFRSLISMICRPFVTLPRSFCQMKFCWLSIVVPTLLACLSYPC